MDFKVHIRAIQSPEPKAENAVKMATPVVNGRMR